MSHVSPFEVLVAVAAAVPEACRANIIIIGSLAAGYHYFRATGERLLGDAVEMLEQLARD